MLTFIILLAESIKIGENIIEMTKTLKVKSLTGELNVKSDIESDDSKLTVYTSIESNGKSNESKVESNAQVQESNVQAIVENAKMMTKNLNSKSLGGESNVKSNIESIESNVVSNESNGVESTVNTSTELNGIYIFENVKMTENLNSKSLKGESNAKSNIESIESNDKPSDQFLKLLNKLETETIAKYEKSIDNLKNASVLLVDSKDVNQKTLSQLCEIYENQLGSHKELNKTCVSKKGKNISRENGNSVLDINGEFFSEECIEQTSATKDTLKFDSSSKKINDVSFESEEGYESNSNLTLQPYSVKDLKFSGLKKLERYTVPQEFYDHLNNKSKMNEGVMKSMFKLWASDNWEGLYDPPSWLKSKMFCMALQDEPSNKRKGEKMMDAKYYLEVARLTSSEQVPEVLKEEAIKFLEKSEPILKTLDPTELYGKDVENITKLIQNVHTDQKLALKEQIVLNQKFREEMILLSSNTKNVLLEIQAQVDLLNGIVNEINKGKDLRNVNKGRTDKK